MNPEIDFNKIAANYLKSYSDEVLKAVANLGRGSLEKFRSKLQSTYADYTKKLFYSNIKTKSFIITEDPSNIYDFYVPLSLQSNDLYLENPDTKNLVLNAPYSIIMGAAGSGKSMLMRYLLLDAASTFNKIPVFIELRKKASPATSLSDRLKNAISEYTRKLDDGIIYATIENGNFVIFLDGFDELTSESQEHLTEEVDKFTTEYPDNNIIVSCRPDRGVRSWRKFTTFDVCPLTLPVAIRLIEKIPRFQDEKERFIDDLKRQLFEKHEAFASNPLLLTILFVAYQRNPKVTPKTSVFFRNAYEALYELHDLKKEGYKREMNAGLDLQDFERVFSTFCFVTYIDRRFEFDRAELIRYVDKSKGLAEKQFRLPKFFTLDFIIDAEKNVALIIEDAGDFSFSHRLFQEYFVATFINGCQPEAQKRILSGFAKRREVFVTDDAVEMLNEMNPALVEQYFVLPILYDIADEIKLKNKVGITHYRRFLKWALKPSGIKHTFSLSSVKGWFLVLQIVSILAKNGVIKDSGSKKVERFLFAPTRGKGVASLHIEVADLKGKSRFLRFDLTTDAKRLFSSQTFPINGKVLQNILDAREVLSERLQRFEHNLDEIFE